QGRPEGRRATRAADLRAGVPRCLGRASDPGMALRVAAPRCGGRARSARGRSRGGDRVAVAHVPRPVADPESLRDDRTAAPAARCARSDDPAPAVSPQELGAMNRTLAIAVAILTLLGISMAGRVAA